MDEEELEGGEDFARGAGPLGEAEALRAQGNAHFRARRWPEAARCYREALALLPAAAASARSAAGAPGPAEALALERVASLGQVVRLNLAACLQRAGGPPDEAISLCDEVLEQDPTWAKALFRRGSLRRDSARLLADPASQREALAAARRDLLQAARAEPGDRQVRAQLEEVQEALRALPPPGLGGGGAGGDGLRRGLGGLYDDREPAADPPPPVVCSVCGRTGHPRCGREFWVQQRAEWLGVPVEEVGREPQSFEDDGTLVTAIRLIRAAGSGGGGGREAGTGCRGGGGDRVPPSPDAELSDSEREMLEDCLDATERPYPRLRRPLSLAQVVRCAEEIWAEEAAPGA